MKSRVIYCLTLMLVSFFPFSVQANTASYQVCFTPSENCTAQLVSEIDSAQRSILVQAYSFTSAPIADALVAAKRKGVDVRVILDKSQVKDRHSVFGYLLSENIPVWIDNRVPIAHSKVMVFDQREVATGSFNFSKNASRNSENLIFLKDENLAKQYSTNWSKRLAASRDSHFYA